MTAREPNLYSRRRFLGNAANGAGMLALASLLRDDGLLAADGDSDSAANPLAPRLAHFAPKARACIYIYLEGAPSQIDLFDPKPKLNELNGQPLPESMTKNVRFAFIQKETARLMDARGRSRSTASAAWTSRTFCRTLRPVRTICA